MAVAGYLFNYFTSKQDRKAARVELEDRLRHETGTQRSGQLHDLDARRRERAYEDRRATYRQIVDWGLILIQQVQLTDPDVNEGLAAPGNPPNEEFARMRADAALFASPEVEVALTEFALHARRFHIHNDTFKSLKAHAPIEEQATAHYLEVDEARKNRDRERIEATQAFEDLATLIKTELATL